MGEAGRGGILRPEGSVASARGDEVMSLQLLVVSGPEQGRAFTLDAGPNLMLGRGQHCHYRLADPRVSRNHCQLLLEGDQVTVVDTGGSGGTLVNGKPVTRHALKVGDVVQVGDTQLRLHLGDFPLDVIRAAAGAGAGAAAPAADRLAALSGQALAHYSVGAVLG